MMYRTSKVVAIKLKLFHAALAAEDHPEPCTEVGICTPAVTSGPRRPTCRSVQGHQRPTILADGSCVSIRERRMASVYLNTVKNYTTKTTEEIGSFVSDAVTLAAFAYRHRAYVVR